MSQDLNPNPRKY